MNFIITRFAYPLKEQKQILNGYYFDNPRTADEIKYVADIIRKSTPFPPNDRLAGRPGYITLDYIIEGIKSKYSSSDGYVSKFIDSSKYKDPCYKLASMWVILRVGGEKTGYYKNVENAQNYIDTVTLLSFEVYDYMDFSVLLTDEYFELDSKEVCDKVKDSILELVVELTNRKDRNKKEEYRFNGFVFYHENILETCKKITEFDEKETVEYITESIKCLRKNHDLKMKFVSIISIIELLLTHSPDANRYNVEESISKQFKNKIGLMCYLHDISYDYEKVIKECNLIYSLRSDVAHGNFLKLDKDLEKYFEFYKEIDENSKQDYDKIYTMDKLICRSLKYMTIILKEYLDDKKLLDIVKKI